jgi:trk system potassium uptake protein
MKIILWEDWKTIFHYSGMTLFFLGFTLLIPVMLGLILGEYQTVANFSIGFLIFSILGLSFKTFIKAEKDASWLHGLCITAFTWILATLLIAIPYTMSGYFGSYLDACFDAMSGLTTTGLSLIQQIDHLPISLNIWRHVLTFIGGQGIIVIALIFLPPLGVGYKALVGEGKEDRLIPSVRETGKAIWMISLVYLLVGTALFMIVGKVIGLSPLWSLFHGVCMFMSAWSTGGFAPQSLNTLYYHHPLFEAVCMLFFILGSMNFGLHFYVWFKEKKELLTDIEIKSFLVSFFLCLILLYLGLSQASPYHSAIPLFRKGAFILLSGHTGTGQMTIYSAQFLNQWGNLGLMAVMLAMVFGGASGSTAGGLKGIRIALFFKGIQYEIRRFFFPQKAVLIEKIHHFGDHVISEKIVKSALIVIILYLLMHTVGAIAGMINGYAFIPALFESISAGANVGLSCGITNPSMPDNLKIVYTLNMFLGRLEFTSIFVFVFFVFRSLVQRKR